MGLAKGISATSFPPHGRDEGQHIMLQTRWGIFPAVIVRQDRVAPFNVIWRILNQHLPKKYFKEDEDLYVSQEYLTNLPKNSPICPAGHAENMFVSIVFDHDVANKCEGICVTDRDLLRVFLVTTGPHEGRYVTDGECQFSLKADLP